MIISILQNDFVKISYLLSKIETLVFACMISSDYPDSMCPWVDIDLASVWRENSAPMPRDLT